MRRLLICCAILTSVSACAERPGDFCEEYRSVYLSEAAIDAMLELDREGARSIAENNQRWEACPR